MQRYPIHLDQVIDPAVAYLTNANLIEAMRNGTGRGFYKQFPQSMVVAGKTGTTNQLRDSWFAGFSRDKLGVIWIGNDDNKPVKLTGSDGALRVWTDMMKETGIKPLRLTPPENIEFNWIDPSTGLLSARDCENVLQFPFIKGSAPVERSRCKPIKDIIHHKIKSFWESIFGD